MTAPLTIDIPHKLGRAGARERLRTRSGELASHIPGGMADVRTSWPSEDEMAMEIAAMGQTISARLEIEDTLVRAHLILPPMLSLFSGMIGSAVRESGAKMLENKAK